MKPTSAPTGTYTSTPVAFEIGLQLAAAAALPLLPEAGPRRSRTRRCRLNVVAPPEPCPSPSAKPVLTGTLPVAATTAAVWAELAGRLGPAVLLAVTWIRRVKPTISRHGQVGQAGRVADRVAAGAVAALPLLGEAVAPLQEPTVPVSVCPTWAVPVTVGKPVLRGTLPLAATHSGCLGGAGGLAGAGGVAGGDLEPQGEAESAATGA